MKICRYKGPNREALYKTIHQEMGPNAVVVSPESSGQGGFGKAKQYELIAILDEANGPAPAGADARKRVSSGEEEELRRLRRQQSRQWRDMQQQLEQLQETIKTAHQPRPDLAVTAATADDARRLPAHARNWDPRFCAWARSSCPSLLEADAAQAQTDLAKMIAVQDEFPFTHPQKRPHIVVLVGPTGSGKTTTLAKLAAICALQKNLKVGLITADTFRVAAVDQIREYASLLDADLRVIFSAEEARAAVSSLSHNDIILVDTPGRAHFDDVGLNTVHKVLQGLGALTVLLTVPATMNRGDLPDMLDGFSRFQPDYLVVTKVDETRNPAIFTSLPFESDRRVAFVTNGQRVPQDIFAARSEKIAELLVQTNESKPRKQAAAPVQHMNSPVNPAVASTTPAWQDDILAGVLEEV